MNFTHKDFIEFLERDYARKIEQLHRHLLSIWTRFNFFITFEGLIISANFITENTKQHSQDISIWVSVLGLITSLIWYCFSANDRYLVKIYRTHVEEAHLMLCNFVEKYANLHLSIDYDMSVESNVKIKANLLGWRCKRIGLTDYATMVPIALFIFWLSYIVVQFVC